MKTSRCLSFFLLALGFMATFATTAEAIPRLVSASYGYAFNPGDSMRIDCTVTNPDNTAQFVEVDVVLINTATGAESTLTPVLFTTLQPGETRTLGRFYTAPAAGRYTVLFIMFDGVPNELDRERGQFQLVVGTEHEQIHAFPEMINLGPIPEGRYMHPMPIEVRFSFFRFSELHREQPFTVRLYTDNSPQFHGVKDAIHRASPAGLISSDGRYTIPMKVWTLNFGPDIHDTGWDAAIAGPPPVDDDDFWIGPMLIEGRRSFGSASWNRIPDLKEMTSNPNTWRRMVGQSPYDNRFVSDSNITGDYRLRSPFTFYIATDAGPTSVEGSYNGTLIVELWAP